MKGEKERKKEQKEKKFDYKKKSKAGKGHRQRTGNEVFQSVESASVIQRKTRLDRDGNSGKV